MERAAGSGLPLFICQGDVNGTNGYVDGVSEQDKGEMLQNHRQEP